MDWAVFLMLGATVKKLKTLTFPYDICFSWLVYFWEWLKSIYSNVYQVPDDLQVIFVIPKFHFEAHREACKCCFHLNHTVGAVQTCREGMEAGWADTNPAALSTHEMSLTYHQEFLNDLFGVINWQKIKTIGIIVKRCI